MHRSDAIGNEGVASADHLCVPSLQACLLLQQFLVDGQLFLIPVDFSQKLLPIKPIDFLTRRVLYLAYCRLPHPAEVHSVLLLDRPVLVLEPQEVIVDFLRAAEQFFVKCFLLDLLAKLPPLKLWNVPILIVLVHDLGEECFLSFLGLQDFRSDLF